MLEKLLHEEFDTNYDAIMDRVFGDQFYDAQETNEKEIKAYLNAVEDEMDGDLLFLSVLLCKTRKHNNISKGYHQKRSFFDLKQKFPLGSAEDASGGQ